MIKSISIFILKSITFLIIYWFSYFSIIKPGIDRYEQKQESCKSASSISSNEEAMRTYIQQQKQATEALNKQDELLKRWEHVIQRWEAFPIGHQGSQQ